MCQRQKPDCLYVLGQSLKQEFSLLERDLRALSPEQIALQARAISLAPEVKVLEKDSLSEIETYDEIILPEDEVSDGLKEKYFSGKKITLDTSFIRWSAVKAFSKDIPDSFEVISQDEVHKKLMRAAFNEAKRSSDWWRQVGVAVRLKSGEVLTSHNQHMPSEESVNIDGDPRSNVDAGTHLDLYTAIHGEAAIIALAAQKGCSLLESEIFVTTFPCPTCAMLIAKAGIKTVYYSDGYSLLNAKDVFQKNGIKIIRVSK